ncbi:ABC transporter ATP-binding protein [Ramlibacter sp. G-1-2-2]|uniref:ABC transporter ATP-binding protein n=1 Tax=Ramlibacter agri TaxID=2728837 RepID=A0A848H688_9BURK|nr:ABC transporter ATP-binding protein [Ramlibacter agri]NML45029.1 ABC transporter ATP-binding protein [Ramlibacter agri]
MTTPLLEVRNLHAGYGPTEVLHGLDFSLEEGHITALLGANGAGKTTTLRAICGMVQASGDVLFDGQRITGKATEDITRLGVAHVPDGRGTFTDLTTEENLRLGAYARRDRSAASLAQDYERMYTLFPILKERRHQQAGTLSGGQQQMLAVARALMLHPRLLLLDEPSFGLAPLVVKDIFEVMRDINATQQVSILLVEQNAAMALKLAGSAHLLETGRIVRSGRSTDLMNDDAVRRAYLGY